MLLLAFNVALALAGLFGGIVLRGIIADVKQLQGANFQIVDRLGGLATRAEVKADVSEVRNETREALVEIARTQQEGFNKVFDKIDDLRNAVAQKADRNEGR